MPSVTNHFRHHHLFSENPLYCFIQNIDIIQQRVKGKTFISVINDFRREIKQQRNVIGHWLSWSQWSEQSTKQIPRVRKRRVAITRDLCPPPHLVFKIRECY